MAVYGEDEILYPIDDKNQEVYHPVSSLKNQNYNEESDDREEFLSKYTINRNKKPSKTVHPYYCSICGRVAILINAKIHKLPVRRTDGSIILETDKYYFKHYLSEQNQPFVIKRADGLDVIYEYLCECGSPVGYSCLNSLPNVMECTNNSNTRGTEDQINKVFFLLNDAIVLDAKSCLVFSELATTKVEV